MKTKKYIIHLGVFLLLTACASGSKYQQQRAPNANIEKRVQMGATILEDRIIFRLFSANATRLQLEIFSKAFKSPEKLTRVLENSNQGVWQTEVSKSELQALGLWGKPFYYGYRAWGPNWPYDSNWKKGSDVGFISDVDNKGNRFNPNKLLTDPYALELSHDPVGPRFADKTVYATGEEKRTIDNSLVAPKGVVWFKSIQRSTTGPQRALKDEVIYEVHVRGLTMNDSSIPAKERGTYLGAGKKAKYLKSLGVTAVEFLPVQETQNEQNDIAKTTDGDNYWGYMTLNYFAPDRRYAFDKSPGGPTQEFANMVDAFHKEGIKVYIDVVYNHTGEGGLWDSTGNKAELYSFRGLDSSSYYLLPPDKKFYWDNTGCGNTVNNAVPAVTDLIVDSLQHWKNKLGVDGFRFDLAATLGNSCTENCYRFDKFSAQGTLNRIVNEVPSRMFNPAGADIIAEAWAIGLYEVGNFPWGWAEWNGPYRDTFRKAQNLQGIETVKPGELASRFAGSDSLFKDDGRHPESSVNFIVAHDGFTLRDVYSYNSKQNNKQWPYGPSDGGEDHNRSWDQGGDPAAQRQAARTGMAILMLSSGVPMITGGDEFYRTQYGNNNSYNLDSAANWLDWSWQKKQNDEASRFYRFSRGLMQFRHAHPSLRQAKYLEGQDRNNNGIKDIQWFQANGHEAHGDYMNSNAGFLAFRIDASEVQGESVDEIFVAYNSANSSVDVKFPILRPGKKWYRVVDTAAWFEGSDNFKQPGEEDAMSDAPYQMHPRSVLVLIQK